LLPPWPHQVSRYALKSCIMAARRALDDRAAPTGSFRPVTATAIASWRQDAEEQTPPARAVGHISRIIDGDGAPAGGSCGQQSSCARPARPVGQWPGASVPPVGREWNLGPAAHLAATALGGVRQVGFVSGEAGLGKTTLVALFSMSWATTVACGSGMGSA